MDLLYTKYKDPDGLLYIEYSDTNPFGWLFITIFFNSNYNKTYFM